MSNNVTYPILRHMLHYIHNQQLHRKRQLLTLGVQGALTNTLALSMFDSAVKCMAMLHNGLQVD